MSTARKPARRGTSTFPDRRSDQTKVQVVYFLAVKSQGADAPLIKIGESSDPDKRLERHRESKFGVTFDVRELCFVRGARADEQQVHRAFADYRVDKETFLAVDQIVDYIRWLRDQYYVWVPDCDQCPRLSELDQVASSLWMPTADRRKPRPLQRSFFDDFGELCLPPREVTIDDFYTDAAIIEPARQALGIIELDPASHAYANSVVKARRFFSVLDDGLSKEWSGRVWLNPPFSEWQRWVPKIIREWESGRIHAMCVLCATRTLTAQYFAGVHDKCSAVCILHGRIAFWGGRATSSPDDGHAVFYFGRDTERFILAFAAVGTVYLKGT